MGKKQVETYKKETTNHGEKLDCKFDTNKITEYNEHNDRQFEQIQKTWFIFIKTIGIMNVFYNKTSW